MPVRAACVKSISKGILGIKYTPPVCFNALYLQGHERVFLTYSPFFKNGGKKRVMPAPADTGIQQRNSSALIIHRTQSGCD
jgi:hypothetical protein